MTMGIPLVERATAAFSQTFGGSPRWIARAPGRVNLIGEHTDYNQGLVLPMAIDRQIVAVGAPARGRACGRLRAADLDETREIDPTREAPQGTFGDYAVGVLRELAALSIEPPPLNVAVAADLPRGSGLSSSAALDVACALLYLEAANATLSRLDIARVAQAAENHFVGVKCGIMDPYVIALAQEAHALRLDCRSLRSEPVPARLPGAAWLVLESGVPRALERSEYNRRREECERAVAAIRRVHPEVCSLRDATDAMLDEGRASGLDPIAFRRARHVLAENRRVLASAEALERRDLASIGRLFSESHASLRDDFEVSSPELDRLVDLAREEGALAARLTGAGFGGCAVALVPEARVAAASEATLRRYRNATHLQPRSFVVRAVAGASLASIHGGPDVG